MNPFWSKKRQELKEAAVRFASGKLRYDTEENDRSGVFSRDGWQACADFGLQGMFLPRRYGGLSLGALDMTAVLEGMGVGARDNGLLFSINAHLWGCVGPIYRFGTPRQKTRFLKGLGNGSLVGALAATESESGSDVFGLKTTARPEGASYVFNGSKAFVTNAPVADIFIVLARTGRGTKFCGLTCFLVERNTPGLSVGAAVEKMGLRTSPMADVSFCDCRVPKENIVGREGNGAVVFQAIMEQERTFILANSIGIRERLLEECRRFVSARKIGGVALSKRQSLTHRIARMRIDLEESRLLLYRAAARQDAGASCVLEAAMAKISLSETYVRHCRDLLQIYGAYGYMTESGVERELRDALASTLYSGTSEVLLDMVAGFEGLLQF